MILSASAVASAQTAWTTANIADSLKKDAYSVVRDYKVEVTATSPMQMTTRYHKVVTILNKKGDDHAQWSYPTSSFTQITSFSGKIYNENGSVRTKLKRGDIHTSQLSEHLASDNQHNYLDLSEQDYPYTIELDWEVKASKGYMDYEYFTPIGHDRQSIEKASFKLSVPTGTQIRYTGLPNKWEPQKQTAAKNDVYEWNMSPMRGLVDDAYDDNYMFIVPAVIAVPYEFKLGESTGTLESWETLGAWYSRLAEGRNVLLPADVQKVKDITVGCKNDMEKIAAIYKYLAEKTRYVSIQLGIGGWQPMPAEEVGKTGFGDCKALTNYMQALLKEAGINSYQTIISTQYDHLLDGFPNMFQNNHVVLTIPQADGSNMVIECTNPQLPLGYVSGSYDGHQALQIVDGKGKLIRIPEYNADNSYENIVAEVKLQADGKATVKYSDDHYGERYGGVKSLVFEDPKKRKDIVAKWIHLQDPVVDNVVVNDVKTGVPHIDVQADLKVTYGKVSGNRILLTCNPFRSVYEPRFRNDRKRPIIVRSAYSLNDEIRITLPEGYVYTVGEKTDTASNEFGSYEIRIKQDGQTLLVKSTMRFHKGRFDISRKNDFVSFREKLSKLLTRSIILEKKAE